MKRGTLGESATKHLLSRKTLFAATYKPTNHAKEKDQS